MRIDLSWADSLHTDPFLNDIFSIAFVRGVEPLDALRRIGGHPDTLAERTPEDIVDLFDFDHGYPSVASVLGLGEWTVLLQPNSWEVGHLADALSRRTEAVSVTRHDYASPSFTHAVDGRIVTSLDPSYPYAPSVADPERMLPLLRRAGFYPFDDEDENAQIDHPIARALRLAFLLTGVLPDLEQLTEPLPSMHFDSWFARPRPYRTESDPLGEAVSIAAELGLSDTPGLAEALAAARRGEPVVVAQDSELGGHVREWLKFSRLGSWSLNSARSRMTEEERRFATRHGWLLNALQCAFQP
ncbi:DUF6461 domain-containing protein [Lentzea sp. NPDC051838]|uniref:DUF6461 domain-containing protein n=1 Tax=Lentzea sp. NPDC051838 TaxID=3154849 RepID=UPI0034277FB8